MCKRLIFVLALLAMLSGPAGAEGKKCPFAKYSLTGTIQPSEAIRMQEVLVLIFLDDLPYASAYPPSDDKKSYAVPDDAGTFIFTSYFSTANGPNRCRGRAKEATLIVFGEGVAPTRKRFNLKRLQKEVEPLSYQVDLGHIEIGR